MQGDEERGRCRLQLLLAWEAGLQRGGWLPPQSEMVIFLLLASSSDFTAWLACSNCPALHLSFVRTTRLDEVSGMFSHFTKFFLLK